MKNLIFILLVFVVSTHSQNYKGTKFISSPDNKIHELLSSYAIELFPNQSFTGYAYYFSYGSAITADLQLVPEVDWLSLNPVNFTSTSCSDVIPVAFNFISPAIPGTYTVEIRDLNNNWSSGYVYLTVTNTPVLYAVYDTLYVTPNHIENDSLFITYSGLDASIWTGYCGPNPYIPSTTQNFE